MPELGEARGSLTVNADPTRVNARGFVHQIEREGVIPRGHRRVGREDVSRRDDLQSGVKVELVIDHLSANQLEAQKRRVALVHVIDAWLDSQRVQCMHATNAEHDFLFYT